MLLRQDCQYIVDRGDLISIYSMDIWLENQAILNSKPFVKGFVPCLGYSLVRRKGSIMSGFGPLSFFKKMLQTDSLIPSVASVAIGDKFEQLDEGLPVWTVERISRVQVSNFPLISMIREDHPELTKTVSLTALEDGEDFRPALQ